MPRIIKETDGGGDPSSGDEDGVPVDPPTLPPLYVPVDVEYETCAAIVVGKYRIDAVEGVGDGDERKHLIAFYEAAIPMFEKKERSNRLMIREKLDVVREGLERLGAGEEPSELRAIFPSIYKWSKAFALVTLGGSVVVVARPTFIQGMDTEIDLNYVKRITYFERVYADIRRAHGQDHTKGRTLYGRVCDSIENIARDYCKLYTDLCPICIQRQTRSRPVAGLKPIVTYGFGTRGQVDLIDFQSMPDGSFRFLMNYMDHGVKFLFSIPIVQKTGSSIAVALLQIFTVIGPPMILQSDNGSEFHGAAMNDRQRRVYGKLVRLTDDEIDEIITEIKQLWPECRMVRGSPRHSQSNGGIERVNRTMQDKLGAWMTDTSSRRWSVGCRLMMWRYNTQIHRTVKDIPYRLVFGQKPRVGISGLHLDYSLLDKLATEADLNKVCNYEGKEEDVVDAGAVVAGKMDVDDEVAEVVSPNKVADTAIAQLQETDYYKDKASPENMTLTQMENSPPLLNENDLDVAELFPENNAENNGIPDNLMTAWNDQNICGAIDAQNPSESPKKKSTNDSELTEWQTMTYEHTDSVIDVRYLHKMRIRSSVAVQWCIDTANIMSAKSFIAAFLVKISKSIWELMDDKGELLQQLDWDGDEGITNLFGTYLQQPNEAFCEYYETQLSENKAETFFVSPTRDSLRKRAGENMEKAASSMKKKALEKYGNEKVCEVGEIVHVRLKNEDKAKVDSGNLTGVIVQVNKGRSQVRVAVKCGLLKSWYAYHRLGRVSGKSNDVALNGLTDALNGWESMKVISEREAARKSSLVGGQGKGDVTCNCKGSCNTNSCSCFKAGRICCSACHRNNFKCCNNDRNKSIKK